jgi:hypothetical protein
LHWLLRRGFATGKREEDVKMLPENSVVEVESLGSEPSAPAIATAIVGGGGGLRAPLRQLARAEAVLRLMNPEPSAFVEDPAPILLTSVAVLPTAEASSAGWDGAALRRVRESRGVTLSQLADRTKVTRHHLENIGDDRYDRLPAYVYLRGILLSLGKELRLDAQTVCRSYLQLAGQAAEAHPH